MEVHAAQRYMDNPYSVTSIIRNAESSYLVGGGVRSAAAMAVTFTETVTPLLLLGGGIRGAAVHRQPVPHRGEEVRPQVLSLFRP